MKSLLLEVLTPDKVVLKKEVSKVECQGEYGRLGILPEHTSLITKLGFGELEYQVNGETTKLLCGKGVLEVLNNHVLVLVDSTEDLTGIDLDRAEASKKRAEDRLQNKSIDIDMARAALALHRAIQRIQFSKR